MRELLVPSQQASVDTGNLGASITENGLNLITGGTGTNDKIIYTNGAGGPGGIICRDANGTKYYYHFDRLGNVVGVTDSNGSVVSLYTMESFGNVLEMTNGGDFSNERSSDVQPYHLTTKEYDADTGLYYFGARWYDSTTGRWLSREPTRIDGPNLYHYGFNRAPNGLDPDGLAWRDWWDWYLGQAVVPIPYGDPQDYGWGDPLGMKGRPEGNPPGTTAARCAYGVACVAAFTAFAVGCAEGYSGATAASRVIEGHHPFQQALGGPAKQNVSRMWQRTHRRLHKRQNAHLKRYTDAEGNHMCPQKGNPGRVVRRHFSLEERLNAQGEFYKKHWWRYRDAARKFFGQYGAG